MACLIHGIGNEGVTSGRLAIMVSLLGHASAMLRMKGPLRGLAAWRNVISC